MSSPITTHVLDTAIGKAAANIPITLEYEEAGKWKELGSATTNSDGRALNLLAGPLKKGNYRITFALQAYFQQQKRSCFYPSASIIFFVEQENEHYHVPLLLSGFGFSTYRGT